LCSSYTQIKYCLLHSIFIPYNTIFTIKLTTTMNSLKLNGQLIKIFSFIFFILFYAGIVNGQMRQVYIDSFASDNAIRRLSFISPSEGYVSFKNWIGYTSDSGHTFTKKYITNGNVNLNGYYINTLAGFAIGGVKTIDRKTIIAYGSYGLVPAILRSTDGGNNFTLVYYSQFNSQELRTGILDMIFPEKNGTGYAVDADRILKTSNGGINWDPVRVDPASYFDRLEAVDNNTVIAMSTEYSTNKALKTTNGGISWQKMDLPVIPGGKFSYIYFLSPTKGWMNMQDNNHHFYIFKTIDGGSNWVLQNNIQVASFNATKMKFINDSVGYAINAGVFKTINSGKVWEALPIEPSNSITYSDNDLQVIVPNQIWAGGEHGFLEMSSNGGGTPIPKSLFLIDTTSLIISGKVNLVNYSRSDYIYKWYKNNVLISSNYSDSYTHNENDYADTIKLIVFNGVSSDTSVEYQYFTRPDPPIPTISAFTPNYGKKGSIINIAGSNFIGVSAVTFGGTPAISFNVTSPTNITAVLDSGRSGEVKIITAYGSATKDGFASQTPILDSFSPKSGGPGTIITIIGESLDYSYTPVLKLGGVATNFVFVSKTTMHATVGKGASGDITFQNAYGTATISGFTYIPPSPPPVISSFSPMKADEGETVTITGTNFTGTTSVNFGVTPAKSFTVISPTTIKAIVGAGSSGKISATTPTGKDSMTGFQYLTPILNSFGPARAGNGTVIQITGENFTGVSSVTFGNIPAASFTINSQTSITAIVAAGASGNVTIVSPHGSVSKPGFIFTTVPVISSFAPVLGPVGSDVKIYGANFNSIAANNIVWFGAVKAFVSAATSNVLTVTVPSGATYQPITVTTNGLTSTSSRGFVVTFPVRQLTIDTYSSKISFKTPTNPRDVHIADLDGDGRPDLIVKSGDTISYYSNNSNKGKLSFDIRKDLFVPGVANKIQVADVDGDGKPDIICIKSKHLSVIKNISSPGSISFDSLLDLGINYDGFDMAIGDMNGDGKQDIIMVSYNNSNACVCLNTSEGKKISFALPFYLHPSYYHEPFSVSIVDFDGDGKPDVAVSNTFSTGYSQNQNTAMSLYRNISSKDTLRFESEIAYGIPGTYSDISSADLDEDGKPEIIFGNQGYYDKANNTFTGDYKITVLKNKSLPGIVSFTSGNFQTDYMGGNYVQAIAFGNFDGDNKPDILVANSSHHIAIIKNSSDSGSVVLNPPIAYSMDNGTTRENLVFAIAAGDLNADSKPEIITCDEGYSTITIYTDSSFEKKVCVNGNASLTSDITGSDYQWQVNIGSDFVNINDNVNYSGTKTQILQLNKVPAGWNNYEYRCVINNSYSHIFILDVIAPQKTTVTISVADTIVCSQTPVVFNALPVNEGSTPTYQWQVNGVIVGNNSSTFTSSSLKDNAVVKLIMTDSGVCSNPVMANSNAIKMTVKDSAISTVNISTSVTNICSGTSTTLTAVPANGGSSPSYQWQVNGGNIGTNSNTLTDDSFKNNDQIKVIMTSNAICIKNIISSSNIVSMNVTEAVIPLITVSSNLLTVIHPDSAAKYTWQILRDSNWSDITPLSTDIVYHPEVVGNYRVESVKGPCSSYSSTQSINVIERQSPYNDFGIYLYPNPSTGFIMLDSLNLSENWVTVSVSNSTGVKVSAVIDIRNKTKVSIDVRSLRTGIYFATLTSKDGRHTSLKFIKP
jgi:photosystem II stability/assembly factor-like uncharacterized protein